VAVCEERNSLKLLQPWLEARLRAGDTEPATHDALGKLICRENSAAAAPFIRENAYYRPEVLGKFLEDIDPNLALLCYSLAGTRGFPKCDEDLLRVSNNYGLFREQARYLIKEQNPDMWAIVLDDENPHRRFLIDQVTQTALPEVENPEDVTATVKAFMRAKLPNELIGLLKKLVLTTSSSSKPKFASNRNLQNLLIITAIKCSKDPDAPEGRVMDFIHRLDNFDGLEIAKIARAEQYGLYEEAFEIYRKYDHHVDAVDILVSCLDALDRAGDYANRVNEPEVWLRLASAQLGSGQVHEELQVLEHTEERTEERNR
jgi:clathrin heavy chain